MVSKSEAYLKSFVDEHTTVDDLDVYQVMRERTDRDAWYRRKEPVLASCAVRAEQASFDGRRYIWSRVTWPSAACSPTEASCRANLSAHL